MDVNMSRDKNVKDLAQCLAFTKRSAPGSCSSDCGCCGYS